MPIAFKVRGGKPGGGKGYLGSEDQALTISTVQEQFLAEPVAFDLAQITSPHVATGYAVRRLLPIETERLQGFPDDWTRTGHDHATVDRDRLWVEDHRPTPEEAEIIVSKIADSHRYRMMGNAVTVPVVEWIARRLVTP